MKTYLPKESEIKRQWHLVDADGKVLGRLAVGIANVLRGRHRPTYTPHLDTGDHVVVINAEKVALTGRKEQRKTYEKFTGWRGGRKLESAAQVRAKDARRMIREAVWGMMPHNRLGRKMFRKLRVYNGPEHEQGAQQPQPLDL